MREFRDDYGVYVCSHVLKENRAINLVIRDPDGEWQFFCGDEKADENSDCHLVRIGELLKKDSSLKIMAELEPGEGGERENSTKQWEFFELDE